MAVVTGLVVVTGFFVVVILGVVVTGLVVVIVGVVGGGVVSTGGSVVVTGGTVVGSSVSGYGREEPSCDEPSVWESEGFDVVVTVGVVEEI